MSSTAPAPTSATTNVLGHLALHYPPGDEQPARRLLELLGCTLVDNGPAPGTDGFCTVMVGGEGSSGADNLMFLSRMPEAQLAVEEELRRALRLGADDEDPAAEAHRAACATTPELMSHIGIRIRSLETLEGILAALATAAAPGGELEGRISVTTHRPKPGGASDEADAAVAARIAASPAFTGEEPLSFAPHWVQCFVATDLCGFGLLGLGGLFELDYVFEPFFASSSSYGS